MGNSLYQHYGCYMEKTFKEVQELTKDVYALLCEEDKEVLYKYASKVPDNGIIVDIGTARGGSAFIMALASKPSVKVYTFDPIFHEEVVDNIKKFNLEDKIVYSAKTSEEMFKDWNQDIDMIFVDGRHHYTGVMEDFDSFGSKVKKGSTVAFHDVLLYDNTIGAAVNDLVSQGKIKHLETIVAKYKEDTRDIGLFVGEKL